jgi:hypothetical protein
VRVLLILAIFASGFAVGSFATGVFIRSKVIESIQAPETVPPRIAARLRRLLGLSDEQTKEVTAIIDKRRLAIQSIRREFQPEIETQLDEAQAEISEVLTAEQRERWQRHFEEMRSIWLPPLPE